jgi:ABC-type multidrug transport system fused ATPase/permease subunit
MSLVLIFLIPVYGVSRFYFFKRIRFHNKEARLTQERLTGTANEYISALRLVRSFGEERQAEDRLNDSSREYAQSRVDLVSVNSIFSTFTYVSNQILALVVVAGGAWFVLEGRLTMGTLVAFISALPIVLSPVMAISQFSEQYFLGEEAFRSIKELLDVPYVESWKGERQLPALKGAVEFHGVSFTYDAGHRPAIRDLTLSIRPGERIAGPSGAGKSTLINLALGLYPAEKGIVSVDGVPLSELDMRWFRRRTAVVMQESILLSGTIAENIRFARLEATDAEVREAARLANAEEFILRLPKGYDSRLGERGVNLSGGQRQRISIARAILRNPGLLILDEATSSLDYESERLVQEALERLEGGRTVLIIAHRLSTIRHADRILVLREGELVEEGSFQELSEKNGYFAALLKAQGPAEKS